MTLYRATKDGQIPLTPEEEAKIRAEWVANEAKKKVPPAVTMRQARLALMNAGLLDDVNNIIVASDPALQLTWEYCAEVKRDDPYVTSILNMLGMTPDQIDDLFIEAGKI